jgi:hypothetical protein
MTELVDVRPLSALGDASNASARDLTDCTAYHIRVSNLRRLDLTI